MNRTIPALIAAVLAAASAASGLSQRVETGDCRTPEAPLISVKMTEPVRVAYLEHVGPYWTLGPIFTRVREAMSDADSGPMFARYLSDPRRVSPSALRAQVGFIAPLAYRLDPPLLTADWNEELVAFTTIDGPYGTTARHYSALHTWIEANGYEAVGPLIELYATTAGKTPTTAPRTEIRIPIRQASVAFVNETEFPTEADEARRAADQDEAGPDVATPGAGGNRLTGDVRPSPTAYDGELPTPSDEAAPSESSDGDTGVESEPTHADSDDISLVQALPAGTAEPQPVPPVAEADATETILDLIAATRFAEVAGRLMPPDRAIPFEIHMWLGQVVGRIGAVARGISHVYPGEGQAANGLADAIVLRYRELSAARRVNPLSGAATTVGDGDEAQAVAERQILRDLDILLGRLAYKTVTADDATVELANIVSRVHKLIRPADAE